MLKIKLAQLKAKIARLYLEEHYRNVSGNLKKAVDKIIDIFYENERSKDTIKNKIMEDGDVIGNAYAYVVGASILQLNKLTNSLRESDFEERTETLVDSLKTDIAATADHLVKLIKEEDYDNEEEMKSKVHHTLVSHLKDRIQYIVHYQFRGKGVGAIDLNQQIGSALSQNAEGEEKPFVAVNSKGHYVDKTYLLQKASKSSSEQVLKDEVGEDVLKKAYDHYANVQMNHKFKLGKYSFSFSDVYPNVDPVLGYDTGGVWERCWDFITKVAEKIGGKVEVVDKKVVLTDQDGSVVLKVAQEALLQNLRKRFVATYDEFLGSLLMGAQRSVSSPISFEGGKDKDDIDADTTQEFNETEIEEGGITDTSRSAEEQYLGSSTVNIWSSVFEDYNKNLAINLNRLDGFLSGLESESQNTRNKITNPAEANRVLRKLYDDEYKEDIKNTIADINNTLVIYTVVEFFKNMMDKSSSDEIENAFINAIKVSSGSVNLSSLFRLFEQSLNSSGLNKDNINRRILDAIGASGDVSKVALGFINSEGQFSARLKQLITTTPALKEWAEDYYKKIKANSFTGFLKTAICDNYLRNIKIKLMFSRLIG